MSRVSKTSGLSSRVLGVNMFVEAIDSFNTGEMANTAKLIFNTAKLYSNFVFEKLKNELRTVDYPRSCISLTHEFAFMLPFAVLAGDEFFTYIGLLASGPMPVSLPMFRVAQELKRYESRALPEQLVKLVGADEDLKALMGRDPSKLVSEDVVNDDAVMPKANFMVSANGHIISGLHEHTMQIMDIPDSIKEQRLREGGRKTTFTPFKCIGNGFIELGADTTLVRDDDNDSHIGHTMYQAPAGFDPENFETVPEEDTQSQ